MSTPEQQVASLIAQLELALRSMADQNEVGKLLVDRLKGDVISTNERIDAHDVALRDKSFTGHTHTPTQVGLGKLPTNVTSSTVMDSDLYLATAKSVYSVYKRVVENEQNTC